MKYYYFIYLLFSHVICETGALKRKHNNVCRVYGFDEIKAIFGKEVHVLCLKLKPIGHSLLTSQNSAILLEPELQDEESTDTIPLFNVTMAYGFPVEDPASGSAEGYIGDDNQFYGVLHLGGRTLHADPYDLDKPYRQFGAFENEYLMYPPRRRRNHAQEILEPDQRYLSYPAERRNRFGAARICDLLLLADKEFYEKDANSSLNHVVRRMLHAIAQADITFRNADFNEDGDPDNIGFSVKYILVLTTKDTNTRVFGRMLKSKVVDGREYLMKFARLRRLSEVCLGVAFSGHAFYNRTLGLSFTSLGGGMGGAAGGLCDRRAFGRSFNTLAVAHAVAGDKERLPERVAAQTLTHEIGHSFGAQHDDYFPNKDCRGYLMGSQSSTVVNNIKYEFSVCSKRLIAATISSMGYCMIEENRPYCGNGIVEEGEACDCGLPSRCTQKDPCCTPRAGGGLVFDEGTLHKEGCQVAPSAVCHPSQGLCCMPNCMYADLTKSGIDCVSQDKECSCNDTDSCVCGLGGRCLPDGTCHASECALLGLRECQCVNPPGGTLGSYNLCGICCKVIDSFNKKNSMCISAEQAATIYMEKRHFLPDKWPDTNYRGPNVSITICHNSVCRTSVLRAWREDEVCVTEGVVGICLQSGLCVTVTDTPRTNVFPEILHSKLSEDIPIKKKKNSASKFYIMHAFYNIFCTYYIIKVFI